MTSVRRVVSCRRREAARIDFSFFVVVVVSDAVVRPYICSTHCLFILFVNDSELNS